MRIPTQYVESVASFKVRTDLKTYVAVDLNTQYPGTGSRWGIAWKADGDTFDLAQGLRIALLKAVTNPRYNLDAITNVERKEQIRLGRGKMLSGWVNASINQVLTVGNHYLTERPSHFIEEWTHLREQMAKKILLYEFGIKDGPFADKYMGKAYRSTERFTLHA